MVHPGVKVRRSGMNITSKECAPGFGAFMFACTNCLSRAVLMGSSCGAGEFVRLGWIERALSGFRKLPVLLRAWTGFFKMVSGQRVPDVKLPEGESKLFS